MKIAIFIASVFALVLGSLVGRKLYEMRQYEQDRENREEACQQTCVYLGKLRVVTVTEKPGCYCADYDHVRRIGPI